MNGFRCFLLLIILGATACNLQVPEKDEGLISMDSAAAYGTALLAPTSANSRRTDHTEQRDTPSIRPGEIIDTKDVQPGQLVAFSKTLMGVPYKYGSTDPSAGFDCSGFITYVFNHFNITVPRSSINFTHVGKEVSEAAAKPGDLILFTGTDSTERLVGHMGIVVSGPPDSLRFIHATSGKAYGVTITSLNDYYRSRYVKTIRIFPQIK